MPPATPEPTLAQGDTLGKYVITRVAGRGGMGLVYAAEDPDIGRTVALKTRRLPQSIPPEKREMLGKLFRQEARTAGNLSHPNIVTIYEVGSHEGDDFIVMEFVPGPTLKAELRQGGPLAIERALDLTSQVCAALGYAHSQGVTHRDVKPANIILFDHNRCKVTDFGVAAIAVGSTLEGQPIMGTMGYMAPEQMTGKEADARSDLFSLGVSLCEMLVGEPLFLGRPPKAILEALRDRSFEIPKGIPAELETLLLKALSFSPDERHQTADEFLTDLETVRAAVDAERQGLVSRNPEAQKKARLLRKAQCAYHPLAPAMDLCSECGKPICASCVQVQQSSPYCFRCAPGSSYLDRLRGDANLPFYIAAGVLVVCLVVALLLRL